MSNLVELVSVTKHFVERNCKNIIHKVFCGVSRGNKIRVELVSDIPQIFGQKLVCVCYVGRNEVINENSI